jgi:hypothetical protein
VERGRGDVGEMLVDLLLGGQSGVDQPVAAPGDQRALQPDRVRAAEGKRTSACTSLSPAARRSRGRIRPNRFWPLCVSTPQIAYRRIKRVLPQQYP